MGVGGGKEEESDVDDEELSMFRRPECNPRKDPPRRYMYLHIRTTRRYIPGLYTASQRVMCEAWRQRTI